MEKAEPLLSRAFRIRDKALSGKHPDRLASMSDLWALHMSRGEFALAEQFAQEGQVTMSEDQRRKLAIPMPGIGRTTGR